MPEETPYKNETTNAVLASKLDSFKELVDTKFKAVEQSLVRIENNSAGFASRIDLLELKKESDERYVTKDSFGPVRSIAYGLMGTTTLAVLGAILTFFLTQRK